MALESLKDMSSRYLGRGIYQIARFRHPNFTNGGLDFNYINAGLNSAITISGTEYRRLPFSYVLSPQGENANSSLVIANVDRTIITEIEKAITNTNITVTLAMARIESVGGQLHGQIEDKGTYDVISCEVSDESITLGIAMRSSLGINVGSYRFSKNNFPNLYL